MTTRSEIVDYARAWDRVRYRHQGRSRDTGIDCAGLIARVGNDTGAMNYDTHNYYRFPTDGDFYPIFNRTGCIEIPLGDRQPGDIVVLRVGGIACHLGILLPDNKIIHAYAKMRKVSIQTYDPVWLLVTDRCYKFPNVTD